MHSKSIKTFTFTKDNHEQITNFFLPDKLINLDTIDHNTHHTNTRTLQTTNIYKIPYSKFESVNQHIPNLARQLLHIMNRKMHNNQVLLILLSKRSTNEHLTTFLLNLSKHYKQHNYSPIKYNLNISHHNITNYLNLTIETMNH